MNASPRAAHSVSSVSTSSVSGPSPAGTLVLVGYPIIGENMPRGPIPWGLNGPKGKRPTTPFSQSDRNHAPSDVGDLVWLQGA